MAIRVPRAMNLSLRLAAAVAMGCISGSARGAEPAPRRIISPDRPLFLACAYGVDNASINKTLEGYRRHLPEEVKPFFCLSFSFHGMDKAGLDLTAQAGLRVLGNTGMGLQGIAANPCVIGCWAYETGFNFGGPGSDHKHGGNAWEWSDRLKDCGGLVGWNSLFNLKTFFAKPDNYARVAAHRDRVFILCKGNGSGRDPNGGPRDRGVGQNKFGSFIHDHEVLTGMYLAGAVDRWGFHPEEWLWYENGYRRPFEYSLPDTRHRWKDPGRGGAGYGLTVVYPECFIGEALANAAVNGCSVLSVESGWPGHSFTGMAEFFSHVHFPVYREIVARKMIPSRQELAQRIRAVSSGSHRRLYATTGIYVQNNGRYGLIPWAPPPAPPEAFREYEFIPGDYHYRHLPFLNALYPEEGRGRSYIRRNGRVWLLHNPFESINTPSDFEIPLFVNPCAKLSGLLQPYSFAVVEEFPDRLEIVLNNYWRDGGAVWDWWVEQDGPSPAKTNLRAKCEELRVSRLRRTALVLDGHAGPSAPEIQIEGVVGTKHEPRWDGRRYALDVDHNGVVRITLKASGKTAPKAPPQGLSRNLLLGRPLQAGSAQEQSPPALAADGVHATAWQPAGAGEQWLRVSLPQSAAISACKVVGAAPGDKPVVAQLQVADSQAGPWRTVRQASVGGDFFDVFAIDGAAAAHARLLFPVAPAGLLVREWGLYTGPNDELKTWEPLVRPRAMADVLALLPKARSDAERAAVESAAADFIAAAPDKAECVDLAVKAIGAADELSAASLMRILGKAGHGRALDVLRQARTDRRPAVREAACWALASWPDPSAAGDVLAVAREAADLSLRGEALNHLLSLLKRPEVSAADRERMLAEGLIAATDDREKDPFFAQVQTGSTPESLRVVASHLRDIDSPWLEASARAACLQIAARLAEKDKAAPRRELEALLGRARNSALRDRLQAVLKELPGSSGQ